MSFGRSVLSLLLTLLLLVACQADNDNVQIANGSSSYQGKDWTLINQKDESINLSDSKGQPTLLIFWATWCPYCKKLLPGIQKLHEKYENKGLKIIAVNIKEDWEPKTYWRNFGYKFDTVLEGDQVATIYGVTGTPGIVFIAPSGKVLGVQSFSDPHHPLLERFAKEGLAMMKKRAPAE